MHNSSDGYITLGQICLGYLKIRDKKYGKFFCRAYFNQFEAKKGIMARKSQETHEFSVVDQSDQDD